MAAQHYALGNLLRWQSDHEHAGADGDADPWWNTDTCQGGGSKQDSPQYEHRAERAL